jgi:hypothetical protein
MALAMRVIIPSGYMPSSERGFALTICAGMDTQTVWMDKSGKLHKEDPSKGKSVEHQPCAFAGAAITADFPATAFANCHGSCCAGDTRFCQARSIGWRWLSRAATSGHWATFLHLNQRAASRLISRLDLGNYHEIFIHFARHCGVQLLCDHYPCSR